MRLMRNSLKSRHFRVYKESGEIINEQIIKIHIKSIEEVDMAIKETQNQINELENQEKQLKEAIKVLKDQLKALEEFKDNNDYQS